MTQPQQFERRNGRPVPVQPPVKPEAKTEPEQEAPESIAHHIGPVMLDDLFNALRTQHGLPSEDVLFVGPGTAALRPIFRELKGPRGQMAWAVDSLAPDSSEMGVSPVPFLTTEEWPTFQLVVLCVPQDQIQEHVEKALPIVKPTQGKIVAMTIGPADFGHLVDRIEFEGSEIGFSVWSAPE